MLTTISRSALAQAASDSYNPPLQRSDFTKDGLSYDYKPEMSGLRTAVYEGPKATIVAHRGTKKDTQDIASDAKVLAGFLPMQARLDAAHAASRKASTLGKPIHHTGHSLGGAVSRKLGRDRGEPNTTFSRYTGFRMNSENKTATKQCKAGSTARHCSNTTDIYNPQDILPTMRIRSDYGRKVPQQPTSEYQIMKKGPLAAHSMSQYLVGDGKKKNKHPQQELLDLALKSVKRGL